MRWHSRFAQHIPPPPQPMENVASSPKMEPPQNGLFDVLYPKGGQQNDTPTAIGVLFRQIDGFP